VAIRGTLSGTEIPIMKPSTVFKSQISDTNACLKFRQHADEMFEPYASAFRRAGKALFELHFMPETRHDLDALPVAFLYRQAVELSLKAIIRMANKILDLRHAPTIVIRKTHELALLLDDCRPAVAILRWKWDAGTEGLRSFDDFKKVISDLENDAELGIDDRKAEIWRYPVKNDRSDSLPQHLHFDVREFVLQLETLLDNLQGLALMLEDVYDGACEALAEGEHD
jgi:hypothetical protein